MPDKIIEQYQEMIAQGTLCADPAQAYVVDTLQDLARQLQHYRPARRSFFRSRPCAPNGIYLWGGVGRGKSFLMDLFFDTVLLTSKRRVHFHEFMCDLHARIASWRNMDIVARKNHPHVNRKASLDDPIPHVVQAIIADASLLCLDEIQVTDIADAMVLGRFFDHMFAMGAVIVFTSNRPPHDLYKDGINRSLFLPAIDSLCHHMRVLELEGKTDYRLNRLSDTGVYFHPLNTTKNQHLDAAWVALICNASEESVTHIVKGRRLRLMRAARGAVRVTFNELCAHALGAEDYLAIAQYHHTVFMENIPMMGPESRNEAKRFVTLIDALYEKKTKFVCSAAAPPMELYPQGDGAFEFKRTVSRLIEMQSTAYLSVSRTQM